MEPYLVELPEQECQLKLVLQSGFFISIGLVIGAVRSKSITEMGYLSYTHLGLMPSPFPLPEFDFLPFRQSQQTTIPVRAEKELFARLMKVAGSERLLVGVPVLNKASKFKGKVPLLSHM